MNHSLTKQFIVDASQSAANMGSGLLDVFSTPSMIALMENTAQELISPLVPEGFSSVGIEINVRHLRATAIGKTVTIKAILLSNDERKFSFNIEAFENDHLIGVADHQRALVNIERFMDKLS